MIGKHRISNCV